MCHYCDKELGGWAHGDDPVIEHHSHSKSCAWAIVCNERRRPTLVPTGAAMTKAREATFVDWPHEKTRGFVGKVKKMAKAGWHHVPSVDSPDAVECLYCGVELDGWEAKDDPVEEHEKRAKDLNCAFFVGLKKGAARKIKQEPIDVDVEVQVDAVEDIKRNVEQPAQATGRGRRTASAAQRADVMDGVVLPALSTHGQESLPGKKKEAAKRKLPKSKARTNLNVDKLYEVDDGEETSTSVAARSAVPVVLQSARKKRRSEEAELDPPTSDDRAAGSPVDSAAREVVVPTKRARRQRTGGFASETVSTLDTLLMSPSEEIRKSAFRPKDGVKQKGTVVRPPPTELAEEDNAAGPVPDVVSAVRGQAPLSTVQVDKENLEPASTTTGRGRGRKRASSTASNASARSSSRRNSSRRGSAVGGVGQKLEDIISSAGSRQVSSRPSALQSKEASSSGPYKLDAIDESQALQEELRLMASSIVKIEKNAEMSETTEPDQETAPPKTKPSRPRASRTSRAVSSGASAVSSTSRRRSSSRLAGRNIEDIVSTSSYHPSSSSIYVSPESDSSSAAPMQPAKYGATTSHATGTVAQARLAATSGSIAGKQRSVTSRAPASTSTYHLAEVISIPSSSTQTSASPDISSSSAQPSVSTRASRRASSRRADGSSGLQSEPASEDFMMLDSRARPRKQRVTGSDTGSGRQRSSSSSVGGSALQSSSVRVVIVEEGQEDEEDDLPVTRAIANRPRDDEHHASAPSSALSSLSEEHDDHESAGSAPAVPEKTARDLKLVSKGPGGTKVKRGEAGSTKSRSTYGADAERSAGTSKALPAIKVELGVATSSHASDGLQGSCQPSSETARSLQVGQVASLECSKSASSSSPDRGLVAQADEEVVEIDASEWERRVEMEMMELDDAPDRVTRATWASQRPLAVASEVPAGNGGDCPGGVAWQELETLDLYAPDCLPLQVVARYGDLPEAELDMTVEQWVRFVNQRQVSSLCAECELLIDRLLHGGQRAKAAISAR